MHGRHGYHLVRCVHNILIWWNSFWGNYLILLMMSIPPKFVGWWNCFMDSSNLHGSRTVSSIGFSPLTILSINSRSLCVYEQHQPCLILCIFVDDGIACSVKMDKSAHILSEMKGTFNITKGHPEIYVGLHIMRDRLTKTIHIDQDRYIEKTLVKFSF